MRSSTGCSGSAEGDEGFYEMERRRKVAKVIENLRQLERPGSRCRISNDFDLFEAVSLAGAKAGLAAPNLMRYSKHAPASWLRVFC